MVTPATATAAESQALVLAPDLPKQETNKSSRAYQISLIAGLIIVSIGVVLIALEALPLLAFGAVIAGMGLTFYSVNKIGKERQKTDESTADDSKGLMGDCDPLVFDDALEILGIPKEEKENLAFITERYQGLLEALQEKIDGGVLSSPLISKMRNMMKSAETAYHTLTKNLPSSS
jgi:hypothetical protein